MSCRSTTDRWKWQLKRGQRKAGGCGRWGRARNRAGVFGATWRRRGGGGRQRRSRRLGGERGGAERRESGGGGGRWSSGPGDRAVEERRPRGHSPSARVRPRGLPVMSRCGSWRRGEIVFVHHGAAEAERDRSPARPRTSACHASGESASSSRYFVPGSPTGRPAAVTRFDVVDGEVAEHQGGGRIRRHSASRLRWRVPSRAPGHLAVVSPVVSADGSRRPPTRSEPMGGAMWGWRPRSQLTHLGSISGLW